MKDQVQELVAYINYQAAKFVDVNFTTNVQGNIYIAFPISSYVPYRNNLGRIVVKLQGPSNERPEIIKTS